MLPERAKRLTAGVWAKNVQPFCVRQTQVSLIMKIVLGVISDEVVRVVGVTVKSILFA